MWVELIGYNVNKNCFDLTFLLCKFFHLKKFFNCYFCDKLLANVISINVNISVCKFHKCYILLCLSMLEFSYSRDLTSREVWNMVCFIMLHAKHLGKGSSFPLLKVNCSNNNLVVKGLFKNKIVNLNHSPGRFSSRTMFKTSYLPIRKAKWLEIFLGAYVVVGNSMWVADSKKCKYRMRFEKKPGLRFPL